MEGEDDSTGLVHPLKSNKWKLNKANLELAIFLEAWKWFFDSLFFIIQSSYVVYLGR